MEYEDEAIGWRLVLRYAGDAKFKGVRSSMPVYTVRYDRRGLSAWSGCGLRGEWST